MQRFDCKFVDFLRVHRFLKVKRLRLEVEPSNANAVMVKDTLSGPTHRVASRQFQSSLSMGFEL